MCCLNSIQIFLFLLPILINCQIETLEKECFSITCTNYNNNKTLCDHVGHIEDPFNNECVAQCDGPCINGYCDYCICSSTNADVIMSAQLSECKRVLNGTVCEGDECLYHMIKSCNSNYTVNPYDWYECLQRCDENSCGNGGTCSRKGYCICHLGYRPDITNPRICLKIPESDTTNLTKTCHRGFKLNDDGECVSTCGDCKNGCCGTDGVCRCWENYELNVASSTCVFKDDEEFKMSCSDKCSNGVCNSDGVCQCPDCSDFIDKTVNCQNNAVYDVANLDANYDCGNTSLGEDMISKTTHKTYMIILACITVILVIATIALILIVLKMKRTLPRNEGKVKILFGELG